MHECGVGWFRGQRSHLHFEFRGRISYLKRSGTHADDMKLGNVSLTSSTIPMRVKTEHSGVMSLFSAYSFQS
jgi:hypothetical protein